LAAWQAREFSRSRFHIIATQKRRSHCVHESLAFEPDLEEHVDEAAARACFFVGRT
jgi:hypothetical protein